MTNTVSGSNMNTQKSLSAPRFIALVGMFGAIAFVLMLIEIPLPVIAPAFYEIDLSEVPVLIGTFSLGPVGGLLIELVKILLHLVVKGTSTVFVGELGNFIIGASLFLPAGLIYRKIKTRRGAVLGMVAGTLFMVVVGSLFNAYVLLPLYATAFGGMEKILQAGAAVHASISTVGGFVALCVAPFNLIKGIITSVVTFFLYKRVSRLIKG